MFLIITSGFSLQATKKGANQTVIGLIFGCYAVCNLIGSLILGRYVSIWNDPLCIHIQNAACFNFLLRRDVRLFRSARSSCWWWGSLCRRSAPSSSGRCRLSSPCYWSWSPQKLFFSENILKYIFCNFLLVLLLHVLTFRFLASYHWSEDSESHPPSNHHFIKLQRIVWIGRVSCS